MQHWDPKQYAEHARFVSDLGVPVLQLLAPQAGETVLDVGCGDGALTTKLIELGCTVVGVDASTEMVAAAKSLGVNALSMDAEALAFESTFDAVFSNAALHWVKNPERAVAAVWRALKPGGRFVGELGGYGNLATIITAIYTALAARGVTASNPWYFPRPEEYRKLLEAQGFLIKHLALNPRPTRLPGSLNGWLDMFAQPYTAAMAINERPGFVADVVELVRPTLQEADGNWIADYVRLRFWASKPSEFAVSQVPRE
ncbi:methyltransferase type 11 [Nitrospira sp.]|nr:methyltransferase type 11 [Nitrospira sp.]